MNQLVGFDRNSGDRTQSWDYDSQGNMQSVTTDGVAESRTHNAQNEVTGVGSNSLTFDSNGNMTTDETGRQFVYDAWNRLVRVKDSGGATLETFGYDGTDWRVTEMVGSTIRDLYYSAQWQVVEETVTTGSTTKLNARYVWGQDYVDDLVYRQRDTDADGVLDERLWATHNANFNITSLADDAGWVVERYAYDAYGVRTVYDADWTPLGASAFGMNYGFQGLRFDAVSGLSDARNRWYSPTLGRFVTNDPIGYSAGDVNLYRFVGNSPGMGVDPWGLFVGFAGAIGTGIATCISKFCPASLSITKETYAALRKAHDDSVPRTGLAALTTPIEDFPREQGGLLTRNPNQPEGTATSRGKPGPLPFFSPLPGIPAYPSTNYPDPPKGHVVVAYFHTHPLTDQNKNNAFSVEDLLIAAKKSANGVAISIAVASDCIYFIFIPDADRAMTLKAKDAAELYDRQMLSSNKIDQATLNGSVAVAASIGACIYRICGTKNMKFPADAERQSLRQ